MATHPRSDETEILQHILEKLNHADAKPSEVYDFSQGEITSLRRIVFTEEEAKTLRSIIEFATGFKTAGKFFNWFRGIIIYIGWGVMAYVAFKTQFFEFLKGVKP